MHAQEVHDPADDFAFSKELEELLKNPPSLKDVLEDKVLHKVFLFFLVYSFIIASSDVLLALGQLICP